MRRVATVLQDSVLLAKLGSTDLRAQDAKYHRHCLCHLYNRERKAQRKSQKTVADPDAEIKALALAELVAFIEESRDQNDVCPVFRLRDLMAMYQSRLIQMGTAEARPNSTRLKEALTTIVPGLQAHVEGRNILLMFEEDVGHGIHAACNQTMESDAVILTKAAEIVRRDMFDNRYEFNGSFQEDCQKECVPNNLMGLHGQHGARGTYYQGSSRKFHPGSSSQSFTVDHVQ